MQEWLGCPLRPELHEKIKDALFAVEEEFDEEKAAAILRAGVLQEETRLRRAYRWKNQDHRAYRRRKRERREYR